MLYNLPVTQLQNKKCNLPVKQKMRVGLAVGGFVGGVSLKQSTSIKIMNNNKLSFKMEKKTHKLSPTLTNHTFIPSKKLPWYNHIGWLGVKHQLTYLLTFQEGANINIFGHRQPQGQTDAENKKAT